MSSFTYQTSNKHRYNIYETHTEPIEPTDYYKPFRNTLLVITLILTLLVIGFVSYDKYENLSINTLLLKQNQKNQVNNEMTPVEISKIISHNIFKKVKTRKSVENIDNQQLKLIIQDVMEKIENSPNKITYTKK